MSSVIFEDISNYVGDTNKVNCLVGEVFKDETPVQPSNNQ